MCMYTFSVVVILKLKRVNQIYTYIQTLYYLMNNIDEVLQKLHSDEVRLEFKTGTS